MNTSFLPVMRPNFPSPSIYIQRLEQVHQSGIFSNYGPQVVELEERFAARFKVKPGQVIVLNNATAALTGLVQLCKPAERWTVPAWTFAASVLGVIQGGGHPLLSDAEFPTHRVPDDLWQQSERALITLPFGTGIPEAWIANGRFPKIIDAAASMASVADLSKLPEESSVVFSLHATKYLGIGEGAVVVSGSQSVVSELRAWSNFGFAASRESKTIGTNAKMSEFQAAIAHSVLDREVLTQQRWAEIRKLSIAVSQTLGIDIPELSNNSIAPYWIVDLKNKERRNKAEAALAKQGIDSRRWWSQGCHRMRAFATGVDTESFPVTDHLASSTLGLPFYLGMTQQDFERVFDGLAPYVPHLSEV